MTPIVDSGADISLDPLNWPNASDSIGQEAQEQASPEYLPGQSVLLTVEFMKSAQSFPILPLS
jgi:hypothetical protein